MKNQKGLAALFKEGSWTSPSWSFLWLVFRDSPHALWLLSMHAAFAGPPPPPNSTIATPPATLVISLPSLTWASRAVLVISPPPPTAPPDPPLWAVVVVFLFLYLLLPELFLSSFSPRAVLVISLFSTLLIPFLFVSLVPLSKTRVALQVGQAANTRYTDVGFHG